MKTRKEEAKPKQYIYSQARGGRIFATWPHDGQEFRVPTELRDQYEDYLTAYTANKQPTDATRAALGKTWSALWAAVNSGRRRAA